MNVGVELGVDPRPQPRPQLEQGGSIVPIEPVPIHPRQRCDQLGTRNEGLQTYRQPLHIEHMFATLQRVWDEFHPLDSIKSRRQPRASGQCPSFLVFVSR